MHDFFDTFCAVFARSPSSFVLLLRGFYMRSSWYSHLHIKTVCVCRTWLEGEKLMKTWKLRLRRSVRSMGKSPSVSSLRWALHQRCITCRWKFPARVCDNICRWHQTGASRLCFQISGVSDEEAVRIFLEFERVESAIKGEWFKNKLEECVCRWSFFFQVPQISLNKAGKCVKAVPQVLHHLAGYITSSRDSRPNQFSLTSF